MDFREAFTRYLNELKYPVVFKVFTEKKQIRIYNKYTNHNKKGSWISTREVVDFKGYIYYTKKGTTCKGSIYDGL